MEFVKLSPHSHSACPRTNQLKSEIAFFQESCFVRERTSDAKSKKRHHLVLLLNECHLIPSKRHAGSFRLDLFYLNPCSPIGFKSQTTRRHWEDLIILVLSALSAECSSNKHDMNRATSLMQERKFTSNYRQNRCCGCLDFGWCDHNILFFFFELYFLVGNRWIMILDFGLSSCFLGYARVLSRVRVATKFPRQNVCEEGENCDYVTI